MNCGECNMINPDGNHYCGQCGAELGRTLAETARKNFRDRKAVEMEITEAVVGRLMKWVTWFLAAASVALIPLAIGLGSSYHDLKTAVATGKTEIETTVKQATKEIGEITQTAAGLKEQIKELQSDIDRYKQVNNNIGKLQKQLNAVQGQIIDLGKHGVRANSFETTGPEPGSLSFGRIGCPHSVDKGYDVLYCAQGSPPILFQLNSTGELRPVSGLSAVGFQDISTTAKPTCTLANRGTFYVEKGPGSASDRPFLCAKESDATYHWIQLTTVP